MRSALREYLRLLLRHWWQLLIGVGFGSVGAVMDMGMIAAPIPSWVWWSFALGSFVFAQFMSFAKLHKEVSKYRSTPTPGQSVADLYNDIAFSPLYVGRRKGKPNCNGLLGVRLFDVQMQNILKTNDVPKILQSVDVPPEPETEVESVKELTTEN